MIENVLPEIKTEVPGEKSKLLLQKRKELVSRGISNAIPIFVEEAKGALIKDVDGNIFLDFASGIGMQNVGHCDDEVVEAIKEQVGKYIHPCFHVAMYEPYIDVAQKLISIAPGSYEKKVLLTNSGAEAVENAIKLSRKYTKKRIILSAEGSFHGRTYFALTLTSKVKPYKYGFGPFVTDAYKIPYAYCYRCNHTYKYPECDLECIERIKKFITTEVSPDDIAAVIVEPIQGEGGIIVPPKRYLQELQNLCKENGFVFIVDEIQTGFGRTGCIFASEYFGLEPDLITVAKSIANGIPLSAVVGRKEILDAPDEGGVGGTYAGSPLACVAANVVIEKLAKERLLENAKKLGRIIEERLEKMFERYSVIGDVRGTATMWGIEFVKDRNSKQPYPEFVKEVIKFSYQRGVIFISAGIYSNVIRLLPPLVMTQEQVEYGLNVLEEAIKYCLQNGL